MTTYRRGKKWWVEFCFNRKRYRRASPENSRAGARHYELLWRNRLARGEPIGGIKKAVKGNEIKYHDFVEQWFRDYVLVNNKLSEQRGKRSIINRHLLPYFGDFYLTEISNYEIEKFKAELSRGNLSNKSINNINNVISKSLRCAHEWELIESLPKIKKLRVPPQQFDYLSREECELLISVAQGWLKDIILLAWHTGLRFGELAALTWKNVDLNNGNITVEQAIARGKIDSPKSNKIRYAPMNSRVREMMIRRRAEIDNILVFPNNHGKYLIQERCRCWLHQLCEQAGVRKVGWHTFRHTFASHLAEKGTPLRAIQILLGHSDPMTTTRYAHLSPVVLQESVRVLE